MGIRKSTRIENYRMIHTWTDADIVFEATTSKVDSQWVTEAGDKTRTFDRYQNAVDWIMDEYRLAKSPKHSWEEMGAEMAGDMGMDWEDLSDDTQQDFIDAARQMARMVQR